MSKKVWDVTREWNFFDKILEWFLIIKIDIRKKEKKEKKEIKRIKKKPKARL